MSHQYFLVNRFVFCASAVLPSGRSVDRFVCDVFKIVNLLILLRKHIVFYVSEVTINNTQYVK